MMRRLCLCATALLLAGCAALPAPQSTGQVQAEHAWNARQARIAQPPVFTVRGRAASGFPRISAQLIWEQDANGLYDLRLSGPLGIGAVRVQGDDDAVRITSRQQVTETADPQGWLEQQTGWRIPLHSLRWWICALPSPDSTAQLQIRGNGDVIDLQQNGWNLRYTDYRDTPLGRMPSRLDATQGEASLTLLIDDWSDLPR